MIEGAFIEWAIGTMASAEVKAMTAGLRQRDLQRVIGRTIQLAVAGQRPAVRRDLQRLLEDFLGAARPRWTVDGREPPATLRDAIRYQLEAAGDASVADGTGNYLEHLGVDFDRLVADVDTAMMLAVRQVAVDVLGIGEVARQADADDQRARTERLEIGLTEIRRDIRRLGERLTTTGRTRLLVRHTLKAPPRHLVDREHELAVLRDRIQTGGDLGHDTVHAIVGMGGVGKSALVRLVAHEVADQFPDAQYELDLYGHTPGQEPLAAAAALETLLGWAGIDIDEGKDLDRKAGLWRDWLRGKRTLLFLDNARSFDQVSHLLPGYEGCLVLVTSRNVPIGGDGVELLRLGGLPEPEAVELLVRAAGLRGAATADPMLIEICRSCGHLPLAIQAVAARLADDERPADLLTAMRAAEYPLAEIADADDAIGTAFTVSYEALGERQRAFLRTLALHPGRDFDVALATALTGAPKHEIRSRLKELRDRHLIERMGAGRFGFHDLFLAYARVRAEAEEPGDVRTAVLDRVVTYVLTRAAQARGVLETGTTTDGFADPGAARTWVIAEQGTLISVCVAAIEQRSPRARDLLAVAHPILGLLGLTSELARVWQTMLNIARQDDDGPGEAQALRGLADVHRVQGRFADALDGYAHARELFERQGDVPGQADAIWGAADIYRVQGRWDDAHNAYTSAQDMYERVHDGRGAADTLWGLGNLALHQSKYDEARRIFARTQEAYRELGDRRGHAQALRGLADVERMLEHHAAAQEAYQMALETYEDLGDRRGQAQSLRGLGHIARLAGTYASAREMFARGQLLCEEIGDRRGQANMLRGLADTDRERGDYAAAQESFNRALAIHEEIGDRGGQIYALRGLGDLERQHGDRAAARAAYERGLAVCRQIDAKRGRAFIMFGLGELATDEGDPAAAREAFTEARSLYESMGVTSLATRCAERLAALPPN